MSIDARSVSDLRSRLSGLTLRDERRLARRLDRARARAAGGPREGALAEVAAEIAEAEALIARRRASVPAVSYPPDLPISARIGELAATIAAHQVVVVAGETGSGKTTQLPKVCLEMGRGVRGRIGHTQPRRLAARTVADRIASELAVELGGPVGYEVRFDSRTSPDTLVSVMTDGLLLAGIQSDPMLRAYDTIVVDEAHERSLNIDFLLGYLHRLLERRPDLSVIITSATIDTARFSRHFHDAPVIEVSGRTYPVEIRYRPLDGDDRPDDARDDLEQPDAICEAVVELAAEGPGDVLVFCSGEREIREAADALADLDLPDVEVLPLYARLSTAQQRRVFAPHAARRVVLATNIAETSLTVPGVRYVVDTGLARISRYSSRLKVQRLPIEKVSQASADQRAGRCGRVADGICIRLYDEADYAARPRFTDPEIQRTNLASVLLSMAVLGLGDVEDHPFLDPPDPRQVRDGVALLTELGALEAGPGRRGGRGGARRRGGRGPRGAPTSLTDLGRRLARLPVDPRLGRMVLEADASGCLEQVLVITAALSIPDPRLRPPDQQAAADASHARFAHPDSDFLTLWNLWQYLRERRAQLSGSAFRRMCHAEHLHHMRVREWQDLVSQLRRVARDLHLRPGGRTPTDADEHTVHRAILAGLLSQIGMRDDERGDYRGARGARFRIQPGSVLQRRRPRYVMAAELVETTRLWARTTAVIAPEWAEQLGAHVVTRTYTEPRWSATRGEAVADERVSLYGVPLVTGRTVSYGRIDADHARELLLRHALVGGEWHTEHAFWHRNRERLAQAEELEDKLRRRDVVVDEQTLLEFYDARVGPDVVSVRHFDRWWRDVREAEPHRLDLPDEMVGLGAADADLPDHWRVDDLDLALSYRFEPGTSSDGVIVQIPLAVLNRVPSSGFDWQVPGLRLQLVTELLRTLPKPVRRRLVPIPATAERLAGRIDPTGGPLLEVLAGRLADDGVDVTAADFDPARVPDHLQLTFCVVDDRGDVVDSDRDLEALRRRLAGPVQSTLSRATGLVVDGLVSWDVGDLPQVVEVAHAGHVVRAHPALLDAGDSVSVRALPTPGGQRIAMWAGTRRLLALAAGSPLAGANRRLDTTTKLALTANPHGSVTALLDDALTCALDHLMRQRGGPVWTAADFATLAAGVRDELPATLDSILADAAAILPAAADVRSRVDALRLPALAPAAQDLRRQLDGLVHPGFLAAKSARRLPDLVRYVEAMRRRLDALPADVPRDSERMARVHHVQRAYAERLADLSPSQRASAAVREIPWMIEELRVGVFAQQLGTAYRVSPERVLRAIAEAS